ncbi:MAG: carbohydrate kinase, partial [Gemmatimonadota bacterium]|nr:carbohydrate kinase [Gemmatimonadota bacterium]
MSNLYLGLDASTQSLSAIIIDLDIRKVVYDISLNYDETLPHYNTQNGVLDHPDPKIVHSPPLMWAEALDVLFDKMKTEGITLGNIRAISGSGQQHGSVYLKTADTLSNLNPSKSLVENLGDIFSRDTSPIW